MFRKILVCLDGSSLAEQILPHVTAEAKSCGGQVILVHVVDISSTVYAPTQAFAKPHWQEHLKHEDEEARKYVGTIAERLRSEGIETDAVVLQGLTGQSIVEYADRSQVDLIALTTHARSNLGRLVFGSVADYVLRNSTLPILTMRPQ